MSQLRFPSSRQAAFTLLELLVAMALLAALALLSLGAVRTLREKGNDVGCVSNLRKIGVAVPLYVGDNDGYLPVAKSSPEIYLNPPNYGTWAVALLPYMSGVQLTKNRNTNDELIRQHAKLFRCPADREFRAEYDHTWSYGWNMACGNTPSGVPNTTDYPRIKLSAFPSPAKIFVVGDAYHSTSGYNYGNAGTDFNANVPSSDSPRSHFRHPAPGRLLTEQEVLSGPPRRNILHLDGHISKRIITTDDTWRPKLLERGLLN